MVDGEASGEGLTEPFLSLSSRHAAKAGIGSTGKIHSLSTFQRYSQALGQAGKWMRIKHDLLKIDEMTPDLAQAYLAYRRDEGIGQKQLDNDRNAMQFMMGKLDRMTSLVEAPKDSRAYSRE